MVGLTCLLSIIYKPERGKTQLKIFYKLYSLIAYRGDFKWHIIVLGNSLN